MSLSAFCIEQREKEGKFLKSFLLYSLVTSSVIHCLALLGIRWFWEPFPALAEDPIEIIMVDAPEPPQPEPPQPEPPQPEPPQPEPPQPELLNQSLLNQSLLNQSLLNQSLLNQSLLVRLCHRQFLKPPPLRSPINRLLH